MFYRSCPCLSFQHGHLSKYRRLGCSWSERETRSEFELFSEQGMNWILEELQLARPKVVIALGSEVVGILQYGGVRRSAMNYWVEISKSSVLASCFIC